MLDDMVDALLEMYPLAWAPGWGWLILTMAPWAPWLTLLAAADDR